MAQERILIALLVFETFIPITYAASPFGMTWSGKSFGPDGPWQAIQVNVGTPAQPIALYPGGSFRSHLLTSNICSNTTLSPSVCFASAGGIYTPDSSTTSIDNVIKFPATTDYTHGGLDVQGSAAIGALDQFDIGTSLNTRDDVVVPNVTIAVHDDINLVYPGGLTPALEVGTLALGYVGTENQTFQIEGAPSINGSLIPGYLQAQGVTASNSFGLHIGSVNPRIPGSLYFGGYDQGRVVGNISTQQGPVAGIEGQDAGSVGFIDLLDVQLNVVDGSSPWNVSNIGNLLAAGNSSVGPALSVVMLPEAPYLDLPKSTCDAIAAWLPVSYRSDLGLYIWNTNDPQYSKIVSSPSVLTFVFRKDQINTANITINVPFLLLNLTLEAPLINTPTQYFPCNAQSYGRYSLGRAFLQAAFLGTNWNANNNQGVWWLAQAPGPNIGSQSNVQTIQDQDSTISASENNWITSWKDSWSILNESLATANGSTPNSTPSATNSTSSTSSSSRATHSSATSGGGISTGAKVGIAVGAAVAAIAAVALGIFLVLRRRKRTKKATEFGNMSGSSYANSMRAAVSSSNPPSALTSDRYRNGGFGPAELHSAKPVYELGQ